MKPDLEALRQRLLARFPDARLTLSDDSHLHAGHTGSAGGAGHFTVDIVASDFAGLTRVARHRLVYDALAEWMPHRIHALIVKAASPAEAAAAAESAAAESAAATGTGPIRASPTGSTDPTHPTDPTHL